MGSSELIPRCCLAWGLWAWDLANCLYLSPRILTLLPFWFSPPSHLGRVSDWPCGTSIPGWEKYIGSILSGSSCFRSVLYWSTAALGTSTASAGLDVQREGSFNTSCWTIKLGRSWLGGLPLLRNWLGISRRLVSNWIVQHFVVVVVVLFYSQTPAQVCGYSYYQNVKSKDDKESSKQ